MDFQAGDMVRFGWESFKKRPLFLIGAFLIILLAGWTINFITEPFENEGLPSFIGYLISVVLQTFLGMGMIALFLKAHDSILSADIKELWHPKPFWNYLGAMILYGLAALLGLVLLIIPGVIAMLALQFADYLVIDRNLGPIEAIKESARITRGHLWELLMLFAFLFLLNLAGTLVLLVGLFVTAPVSMLAIVHAYRTLSEKAAAPAASPASAAAI